MPSKPPLVVNDSVMAHLRACKAQGLTKTESAEELGVHLMTLNKAIKKASPRVQQELARMWPHGGYRHGNRTTEKPQVKWLTRPWRTAA
ncbi:hypothetical protein [Marinobacter sp. CA1]|uniref:hypothetical protein n=1 Tax=Marinobacter sp. CA1 TaxID=2817656 RepID=UPI001D08E4A9|nr:hypothetical protein [Marinobacter sp. CA1]UDL04019.1 hypothetical protein J2887_15025 [Marinobacter sp. CA1]